MTEFTASNGYRVIANEGGTVQFIGPEPFTSGIIQVFPGSEWWDALREFFQKDHPDLVAARARWQHQEDARLGRWRWPENADYVVYLYSDALDGIRVMRESDGHSIVGSREWFEKHGGEHSIFPKEQPLMYGAARAYFDAHPEPKPWHDAKPGEVWVVRLPGWGEVQGSVVTNEKRFAMRNVDDPVKRNPFTLAIDDDRITEGRRIWPEATS